MTDDFGGSPNKHEDRWWSISSLMDWGAASGQDSHPVAKIVVDWQSGRSCPFSRRTCEF